MIVNKRNIVDQVIGTAIGTLLALGLIRIIVVLSTNISEGKIKTGSWLWISVITLGIILLVTLMWRTFRRIIRAIGKWVIINWVLILALIVLCISLYGIFFITHNLVAIGIAIGLFVANILLIHYWHKKRSYQGYVCEEFTDNFAAHLEHWSTAGEWRIVKENSNSVLSVTRSDRGGILKPCLSWANYIFEFETKIVNKNTSWIIRASNPMNYVMLQCQQNKIFPHFRLNDNWYDREWTIKNPTNLPVTVPLNQWFKVIIKVVGVRVKIFITLNRKRIKIFDSCLLSTPPAPIQYSKGSVGFREYDKEHSCFRNISVKRLCEPTLV